MRTLVSGPVRLISIAWVPICSPLRMMANHNVSAGVCAATAVATTRAPSVALMTALNVPMVIFMPTLHTKLLPTNTNSAIGRKFGRLLAFIRYRRPAGGCRSLRRGTRISAVQYRYPGPTASQCALAPCVGVTDGVEAAQPSPH